MKKVFITIEKTSDGYSAYAENIKGVYAMGEDIKEVKQSVLDAIETLISLDEVPSILKVAHEIIYKFDLQSLLNYYKGIMSFASLERITGVNQKQLQHYSTGHRKPRIEKRKKIETALHKFGNELLSVELV